MDPQKARIISFAIVFAAGAIAVTIVFLSLKELTVPDEPFVTVTQPSKEVKGILKLPDTEVGEETTILAVGDIMLGRYVETLMDKNGDSYPFENVKHLTNAADFVLGNLEGPIVANHVQTPDDSLSFSFKPETAQILADYNFGLVTLANNHTYDRGVVGYTETQTILNQTGIATVGHPTEVSEDYIYNKILKGQSVVFLGFNATRAGFDQKSAVELINAAAINQESFIIATIHWGSEYQPTSNQSQKNLGHSLIDAGADLIIGHHPHVVQEIELYNDKLIFYSLGNFIFDQYFSDETQEELAVKITLSDKTVSYQLYPLQSEKSQPSLMDDNQQTRMIFNLKSKSNLLILQEVPIILNKY